MEIDRIHYVRIDEYDESYKWLSTFVGNGVKFYEPIETPDRTHWNLKLKLPLNEVYFKLAMNK
jgi:hypothetical protein